MPVWYRDKKTLKEQSPSLSSGLEYMDEIRYRREGSRFIQELGKSLGLRHDTMATASIYFHRFYLFHSFISFPRYVTSACALFLAGKAEETPKKCRDIIKNVKELLNSHQFTTFGNDPREEVMTLERVLLQTIKFDLQVDHPYSSILKYAKCLKGDNNKLQKMVQMSWTFVNDSLCTTLCLQWEPEVIAIALMYLAAKLSKFEVKDWKNRKEDHRYWWDQYVQNLNTEILEDICHQVLDLYSSPAKNAKEAPPSPPPGSRPPPISTPRNSSQHKDQSSTPSSAMSYKQALMTQHTPLSSRTDRKSGSLKSASKPPHPADGPLIAVAAPLPSQHQSHQPSKPSGAPPQPSGKPPPMPPSAPPPKASLPPIAGMPPNLPPQAVGNLQPPPPVTPTAPMMYGSGVNYATAGNIPRNQQTAMFQTGYAYQAPPPGLVSHNAPPPNLNAPPPSGYMPSGAPPSRPPIVSANTPGSGSHQHSSPMSTSAPHRHHPPPTTSGPPPVMPPRGLPPNHRGGPPPNLGGPPPDTSRGGFQHHSGHPLSSHHGGRGGTPTKDLSGGGRGGPPMMNMSPALRPLSTPPQWGVGGMGGSAHTPSPMAGGQGGTPRGPYPQTMGGGKMQGNNQGGNNRNTPYQRQNYQGRPPHGGGDQSGGGQRWNN